jgi:hypothetical protein
VSAREKALDSHRALLNGGGRGSYFEDRRIRAETFKDAWIGYDRNAFTYPCIAKEGGLLGIHYKGMDRDANGKRQQWWGEYADDLPRKGCGKEPGDPAKVIPFGMESLKDLETGSLVVLCCGEEDALSLRQVGYTSVSQPGAGLLEPVYAKTFADLNVVVFYDAGEEREARKDALKVKQAGAGSVRIVEWPPETPHGADINGRLVDDPEGFEGWAARMIRAAKSLASQTVEHTERSGRPDRYHGGGHQTARENGSIEWEAPVPLPEGLPPVASLDPAMLPEPLRGWIADISERMQIPSDFAATGALIVAGSLVGRRVGIFPKQRDDWLVVPNLWGAVIGRPSLLKSPALAEVMKPLDRLVAEAYEQYEEAKLTHETVVMIAEAKKEALQKDLKQAAKTGSETKLNELAGKLQNAELPEEPVLRRYKTSDATVEKISEILLENPQGILVYRDELSGWLRSLDKQGREVDRAFYLESWNGTGSFDVDRIGRGSLHIPALCLSILGSIQPGPLSSYVYQATQGEKGDDGLLQRFQLLVWPDAPTAWKNVDCWPDSEAKNRAYEVFKKLNALDSQDLGAVDEDEESTPAVRFTDEAQDVFDRWREELEGRLRTGELPPALESHLAKYRSLMPSLALIFQLIEYVDGTNEGGAVGLKATLQAAAWCEYLETHAMRLYSSAENPAMEGARALLDRIRKGDVQDGDSTQSVYRRHWAKLSTPEEVSSACSVLEAFGWLRVEVLKTGGRSTSKLHLHPALRRQM